MCSVFRLFWLSYQYFAKWLARKTPLRKPNCGDGIVSRKPRQKSAYDFLGLFYCFIVLLCICVVSCPYMIYYPTVMAWYSLFVLKVPLNPKQTNKHIRNKHLRQTLILIYGMIWPVCAESAVNPQSSNQPATSIICCCSKIQCSLTFWHGLTRFFWNWSIKL